jgi:ABC-type nitrate/sulfonate/bicarbonate transport system permease component
VTRTSGLSGRVLAGPVPGLAGIAAFLVAWEAAVRFGLVDDRYIPPASDVLAAAVGYLDDGVFWSAVGRTLGAWALGLAIAAAAAVVLGIVIGSSGVLRRATHSTIEFLRPIPSVALIPLAVLVYGTSLQSTLLLVVYASFWQILIQVLYGVQDVDPIASDTAHSYRLGRIARVRYLVWPSALPYVMTGLRLGAAVALILAITAELVIGGGGLGERIALAQSGGAVDKLYALIVITGLIGVAVNLVMRAIERRALAWHTSVRGEVPV